MLQKRRKKKQVRNDLLFIKEPGKKCRKEIFGIKDMVLETFYETMTYFQNKQTTTDTKVKFCLESIKS